MLTAHIFPFRQLVLTLSISFLMLQGQAMAQATFITYNESPSITKMMDKYKAANRNNPVDGWRVQVVASTDRRKVEESLRNFKSKYPDIVADWYSDKPYYRQYAGAFRQKWEAFALLQRIRADFSGAFVAKATNIKQLELSGL